MTRWEARGLDSKDQVSHPFLGGLEHYALKATAFHFAASNPEKVMFYNTRQ